MDKGFCRLATILKRLAEGEMEMEAIFVRQLRMIEGTLHRGEIVIAEGDRLEICKAPPDFAQLRRDRDRPPIGVDAVCLPPDRLQHMAVGHPDLRLLGVAHQDLLVERDGLVIFTDPSHCSGLEVGIAGMFRINRRKSVELGQGFCGLRLTIEHCRQVRTRREEIGRELDRAAE